GTDFVTPLLAGTDYTANSLADGTGVNLTGSVTVAVSPYASWANFIVSNTHPTATAYVTVKLRGRGIRDNAQISVESYTVQSYGDQPFTFDLRYQNDPNIAQGF